MLPLCIDIPDKTINSSLYDLVRSQSAYRINGKGLRTSFTFANDNRDNESLNLFLTWIESSIKYAAYYYAAGYYKEYDEKLLGFNPSSFNINECWGVLYNKGEGVIRHNHFPYALSFVYYVRMPEGSSPLILDDEEILLPEGRVIFFLGHQFHSVPPSAADDRCIIAGNISYNFQ